MKKQAIGRVDRIGQTRETFIHHFVVLNTVEPNVVSLFQEKRRAGVGNMEIRQEEKEVGKREEGEEEGADGREYMEDGSDEEEEEEKEEENEQSFSNRFYKRKRTEIDGHPEKKRRKENSLPSLLPSSSSSSQSLSSPSQSPSSPPQNPIIQRSQSSSNIPTIQEPNSREISQSNSTCKNEGPKNGTKEGQKESRFRLSVGDLRKLLLGQREERRGRRKKKMLSERIRWKRGTGMRRDWKEEREMLKAEKAMAEKKEKMREKRGFEFCFVCFVFVCFFDKKIVIFFCLI